MVLLLSAIYHLIAQLYRATFSVVNGNRKEKLTLEVYNREIGKF